MSCAGILLCGKFWGLFGSFEWSAGFKMITFKTSGFDPMTECSSSPCLRHCLGKKVTFPVAIRLLFVFPLDNHRYTASRPPHLLFLYRLSKQDSGIQNSACLTWKPERHNKPLQSCCEGATCQFLEEENSPKASLSSSWGSYNFNDLFLLRFESWEITDEPDENLWYSGL